MTETLNVFSALKSAGGGLFLLSVILQIENASLGFRISRGKTYNILFFYTRILNYEQCCCESYAQTASEDGLTHLSSLFEATFYMRISSHRGPTLVLTEIINLCV